MTHGVLYIKLMCWKWSKVIVMEHLTLHLFSVETEYATFHLN